MKTENVKFVNLTPHEITFLDHEEKVVKVVPASGNLARVSCRTEDVGFIDGIPVTENVYGKVEGLPDPTPGVIFIVSALVAQRVRGRMDVFIPNDSIRDDKGRIIGCLSLGRI